jgi:hypothetical protein
VIRDVYPDPYFSIPDPRVKKAPDPGSATLLSKGSTESVPKRSGPGSPTVSIKRGDYDRTLVIFGLETTFAILDPIGKN